MSGHIALHEDQHDLVAGVLLKGEQHDLEDCRALLGEHFTHRRLKRLRFGKEVL